VVLSRALSGEADLVATFLTRELGLLTALAKNARKSVRRFGGGLLYPGAAAYYDFRVREGSEFAFVERGEFNPKAPVLPPDPVIQALAAWALELTRAFEAPRNPAPKSFNLLLRHLGALAQIGPEEYPYLRLRSQSIAFTKLYMELAGFGPDFDHCWVCGSKTSAHADYLIEGTDPFVICPACADSYPASPGRLLQGTALVQLKGIKDLKKPPVFDDEGLRALEYFYQSLAASSSGRVFKTRKALKGFLDEAEGPDPP
jgi:DNA repair protein RecO (recombination protein O)